MLQDVHILTAWRTHTTYKHGRPCQSLQRINENRERQMLLKDSVHNTSPFNLELCKAMVAANIPFAKLDNTIFKTFLKVNTKQNIPDRTTLTKFYLPKVFSAVSNKDCFEY